MESKTKKVVNENTNKIRLDLADLKFKPPTPVINTIKKAAGEVNRYPSGSYNSLKLEFAKYAGIKESQVLFGNGLDEIIDLCSRRWGGRNLIPTPTFGQYKEASKRSEQEVIEREMLDGNSYSFNLEEGDYNSDIIWICNPNNPTGTLINKNDIESVVQRAKGIVIVDECYYEYSQKTVSDLVKKYNNLVVIRSFSKNFGIAGLRLGAAISQEENIQDIKSIRQPFNVNLIAEKAGTKALKNIQKYKDIWKKVIANGEKFADKIESLGFKTFDVNTNFVLCDFRTTENSRKIYEGLKKNGIKILPGWSKEFTGLPDRFLRFTIGREDEMFKTSEIIENLVES